jgi:hypothetical protein
MIFGFYKIISFFRGKIMFNFKYAISTIVFILVPDDMAGMEST